MRRLLWLIPLLAGIAGTATAATDENIPDWGRWALAGTALAGAAVLGIAVLIGPAARRLAGERHPLTQAERGQMTATERVEAVNSARHTLIQAATGLVVIGGVVFTAQGLWYTAQSLDASRDAQRTAEQGQITDRYTKAVEQLGSTKMDVRLGGLYALERLAQDSPRDHQTVYDVLAAFVREHDPRPSVEFDDLPLVPTTDVHAALIIIGRRDADRDKAMPNLGQIRIPRVNMANLRLRDVNLFEADLREAVLLRADLSGADLSFAELSGANLSGANLHGVTMTGSMVGVKLEYTNLNGMNLTGSELLQAEMTAASLRHADLSYVTLTGTILRHADLTGANLTHANLRSVDLRGATLAGTDLRGADLRGVRGVTEDKIRKVAQVNTTTRF